jgi:hypothetical protein
MKVTASDIIIALLILVAFIVFATSGAYVWDPDALRQLLVLALGG